MKNIYNTKMEVKPENVPDEHINPSWDSPCTVAHPYEYSRHCPRNLRCLHDWLRHPEMQAGEHKLLIHLDMEELFSEQTVTTFGFIKPKDDVLTQLTQ